MAAEATGLVAAPIAGPTSLTRRASLTAIAALVDYVAKLGVGLLITPVLVHSLGRATYGMWEMLLQLIGYMTAADGRPTDALRLIIANRQGIDDAATRRRQVGAALVVWGLFLPLVAAAGALLVWLAPMITRAGSGQFATVRWAAGFLVLSFIVAALAAVPEAVLRGMNLGFKRVGWQAALSVLSGVLLVGAVSLGFGLPGMGAAQIALFAVTGLCFWIIVRRHVPGVGIARPMRHEVRHMVGMSAWLATGDVISKLLLASDVVVLGAVVSPALVTTYVLTGYATRTATGIFGITIGAAMPGIGGLVGRAEYERAAALRRELLACSWVLAVAVGATVLAWNQGFLQLWVGGENYAGAWANLLLVCVMTQTMLIRSDSFLIDAALRPRQRVLVGAAAAAVTIGATIPLTRAFGIIGLLLGILIGRSIQSLLYPMIVASCLRIVSGLPLRPLVRPVFATAGIFAAAAGLGSRVVAGGWTSWTLGVATTLVAASALALFVGLNGRTRQAILNRAGAAARSLRG